MVKICHFGVYGPKYTVFFTIKGILTQISLVDEIGHFRPRYTVFFQIEYFDQKYLKRQNWSFSTEIYGLFNQG